MATVKESSRKVREWRRKNSREEMRKYPVFYDKIHKGQRKTHVVSPRKSFTNPKLPFLLKGSPKLLWKIIFVSPQK